MNNNYYNTLLTTITADIAAAMQQDHAGPYWLSPYYDRPSHSYLFKDNPEIFNGNAGICLFYLHLYQLHHNTADLQMATAILRRILGTSYITQPRYYGFYTGITGIVYTCISLYQVTQEPYYLDQALHITRQHKATITRIREMDLLTGVAGVLIVMTLLYHHDRSADILNIIHQLIDLLITDARISQKGLKWDHRKMAFDSLTGLSHGAAGIAYALMQTGHYFQYDGLIYLAEQALEYEMQYYQPQPGNWLDLRIGHKRYNLPGAHHWQLATFFPELKLVNSWAHGAAGIALSRNFAWQVTGAPIYQQQVNTSIAYCLSDLSNKKEDYTICSGRTGIIPLLLRSGLDHSKEILQIFRDAFQLYTTTGGFNNNVVNASQDTGLFSGKAGVGLMLINVLSGQRADDILLPTLPPGTNILASIYTQAITYTRIYSKYPPATEQGNIITEIWRQHKGALCYYKKISYLQNIAATLLQQDHLLQELLYIPDHIIWIPPNQLIEISSNDVRVHQPGPLVSAIVTILQTPCTGQELITQLSGSESQQQIIAQLKTLVTACFITADITKGCHR